MTPCMSAEAKTHLVLEARRESGLVRVQLTRLKGVRRGLVEAAVLLKDLLLRSEAGVAVKGGKGRLSLMIDESGLIEGHVGRLSMRSGGGHGFRFVLLSETAGVSFGVVGEALNALLSKGFRRIRGKAVVWGVDHGVCEMSSRARSNDWEGSIGRRRRSKEVDVTSVLSKSFARRR